MFGLAAALCGLSRTGQAGQGRQARAGGRAGQGRAQNREKSLKSAVFGFPESVKEAEPNFLSGIILIPARKTASALEREKVTRAPTTLANPKP